MRTCNVDKEVLCQNVKFVDFYNNIDVKENWMSIKFCHFC